MKRCSGCKKLKKKTSFAKKRGEELQARCRTCQSEYHKEWVKSKSGQESVKRRAQRARERIRKILDEQRDRPCADCGRTFPPYAMDFDHVRGNKSFALANAKRMTPAVVLAEISKCEVVCAVCHRIRTWKRSNGIALSRSRVSTP